MIAFVLKAFKELPGLLTRAEAAIAELREILAAIEAARKGGGQ